MLLSNMLGLKVISLFGASTLKYGICNEDPSTFDSFKIGFNKPDCLSTVGSGWKNLGKYTTGMSYIFNNAWS